MTSGAAEDWNLNVQSRVTTLNLRVEKVDASRDLIFLRGAVPGHRDGLVRIRHAVRAPAKG